MHWLIAVFLVMHLAMMGSAPAHADATACPAQANGAVIYPKTDCALTDNTGITWSYRGGSDLFAGGVNHGAPAAFGIGNCGGLCPNFSAFINISIHDPNAPPYFHVWIQNNPARQAEGPNSPPIGKIFQNTTTKIFYPSQGAMIEAAGPNAHLHSPKVPSGVPIFFDGGMFTASGVTLTCDSGQMTGGVSFAGGKGNVVVDANNITIDGCTSGYLRTGENSFGYRVDPHFTGFTLKNSSALVNDTCIDTGGYNGTTTIINVVIDNCGDVTGDIGQTHNIYLGQDQRQGYDDSAAVIDHLTSTNVRGGGHLLKIRVSHLTMTNSTLACTRSGRYGCNESRTINLPCGGVHTLTSVVAERGPNAETDTIGSWGDELASGYGSCGELLGDVAAGSNVITNIRSWNGNWWTDDPSQHGFTQGMGLGIAGFTADYPSGGHSRPVFPDGTTIISWTGPIAPSYHTFMLNGAIARGDTFQIKIDGKTYTTEALPQNTPAIDDVVSAINTAIGPRFHCALVQGQIELQDPTGAAIANDTIAATVGAAAFSVARSSDGNPIPAKPGHYSLAVSQKATADKIGWNFSPALADQSLMMDRMIFINDGPRSSQHLPICLIWDRYRGQSVNTVTIKNSIIVNSPSDANGPMTFACGLGNSTGHAVTIGPGNLCYASRSAAFGAGHDYPYLPPPLTSNPVPNGREVPCPLS